MMRLSAGLRNPTGHRRGTGPAARRHAGTWFLLLVGFSVGVAPIHCALYSCHVAAMHESAGHHGAGATQSAAGGGMMAESGPAPHGHRAGSQAPESGEDVEDVGAEFDPPGAMTPGSMSTLPAILGSVAAIPLPPAREHVAPIAQKTRVEVRLPDLQPPRA